MKRNSELKRSSGLQRSGALSQGTGKCQFHKWVPDRSRPVTVQECAECGKRRVTGEKIEKVHKSLRRGRGFSASPSQRRKVRGMACVGCGRMADEFTAIDPAHLCARGMGGCDHEDCVIPLCRDPYLSCHRMFDRGELELAALLEPAYRREVAHCVEHLGLYGTLRRLSPNDQYREAA